MSNASILNGQREVPDHVPGASTVLKMSVGLLLFTATATAFVYAETVSVEFNDDSFDVKYDATGVTVSGVVVDYDIISLTFAVDVPDSDGVLDVSLDRSFFDSVYDGLDDDFIALVDDDRTTVREIDTTSESRTLRIELPAGSESVEIIGSVFVPLAEDDSDSKDDTSKDDTDAKDEPKGAKDAPAPAKDDTDAKDEPKGAKDAPAPAIDVPKNKCGGGTILKDGICVLDERCGTGTVLKDGICVLDTVPKPLSVKLHGKDLVVAAATGFVISGVLGIILGIFAWAHRVRN